MNVTTFTILIQKNEAGVNLIKHSKSDQGLITYTDN